MWYLENINMILKSERMIGKYILKKVNNDWECWGGGMKDLLPGITKSTEKNKV